MKVGVPCRQVFDVGGKIANQSLRQRMDPAELEDIRFGEDFARILVSDPRSDDADLPGTGFDAVEPLGTGPFGHLLEASFDKRVPDPGVAGEHDELVRVADQAGFRELGHRLAEFDNGF